MIKNDTISFTKDLNIVDISNISMNAEGVTLDYEVIHPGTTEIIYYKLLFTNVRHCSLNQFLMIDWGLGASYYSSDFQKLSDVLDILIKMKGEFLFREIIKLDKSIIESLYYYYVDCEYFLLELIFDEMTIIEL